MQGTMVLPCEVEQPMSPGHCARDRCGMKSLSNNSIPDSHGGGGQQVFAASPAIGQRVLRPLATTRSACCCDQRPAVVVLVPRGTVAGEVVELLLCARHFHKSASALEAAAAGVFDARGRLLMPTAWQFPVDPLTMAWWSDELYEDA